MDKVGWAGVWQESSARTGLGVRTTAVDAPSFVVAVAYRFQRNSAATTPPCNHTCYSRTSGRLRWSGLSVSSSSMGHYGSTAWVWQGWQSLDAFSQARLPGWIGGWEQRYFVLDSFGALNYYENEQNWLSNPVSALGSTAVRSLCCHGRPLI
jgi:hypothetical protein